MGRLQPPQRVLIVGGGEFGSTTALQLAQTVYKGNARLITILDRSPTPPATDAASYDLNKIVRQEYTDLLYARLAHRAMERWRTPEWRDNYHESGVVMSANGTSARAGEIQRALDVNSLPDLRTPGLEARLLPLRKDVEAIFPEVPLGNFADQHLYINHAGGWANARGATEAVVARCRALGVRFEAGTATELIADGNHARGVRTLTGEQHMADFVILCLGSWTPTLLPELKDECLPTGQVVGAIQLTPQEAERYASTPVVRLIDSGFYIFPSNADGLVKFAIHQRGYLNPQPGLSSAPRTALSAGFEKQRVPESGRRALEAGLGRVYPELAGREWAVSRLCWYSDRPSGDFLLDYHPKYGNLFVAAGCSGHAFKFMPVLGELIVQGIMGQLPRELRETWAWAPTRGRLDGSRGDSVHYRLDAVENTSRL